MSLELKKLAAAFLAISMATNSAAQAEGVVSECSADKVYTHTTPNTPEIQAQTGIRESIFLAFNVAADGEVTDICAVPNARMMSSDWRITNGSLDENKPWEMVDPDQLTRSEAGLHLKK